MGFFGATRAAKSKERHVVCPRFVVFDFDLDDGGPFRLWEGASEIVVDGETYRGFAEVGSISDAAFGAGDAAGNITYQLSGVSSEVVEAAQSQADKVRGRDVQLFGHFLDADTLQLFDDPFVIRNDIMDTLHYAGQGPSNRTVTLTAETFWTARNAAAYAYYSPKDQEARFPGDRGLDFVPTMKNKRVAWPLVGAF